MPGRPLRILVLSTFDGTNANVIGDFLFAFRLHSRHEYFYVFNCHRLDRHFDLSPFDAILIFWSLYLLGPDLSEEFREHIRRAPGYKVLFRQDEYGDVRAMNRAMDRLGIQLMFTCVADADHGIYYPPSAIPSLEATYTVLPGYVPSYLESVHVEPSLERPLDIGYRSREVPYYLGDLGREKKIIADRFQALSTAHGWRADISTREQDRLYGRRWVEFLRASRCVLGTASGASVVDFTGAIRRSSERYLAIHPRASYEDVKHRFFADVDWKVVLDTVSPRVLEAAALGCALVHHEGGYRGLIEPDRHYICVKRDYSNISDVVERIKDRAFCRHIAANAHAALIASRRYGYPAFAAQFDALLDRHVQPVRWRPAISARLFYTRNYLWHGQDTLPLGDRGLALPSRRRAVAAAGRALTWLSGGESRPLVSRLARNPVSFVVKVVMAWRIAVSTPALRAMLSEYLRWRSELPGVRVHQVLDDLLKLDIVRRARAGVLRSRQPFAVTVEYESGERVLSLTSVEAESHLDGDGDGYVPDGPALSASVADALTSGQVRLLIWDHSALSLPIVYRPGRFRWLIVGLGTGGVHRFEALSAIAARETESWGRILGALLRGLPSVPADEVGRAQGDRSPRST